MERLSRIFNHNIRAGNALALLLSLIICLITFQRFEPVYGRGLDPSYIWAFNYLIGNDYGILTALTYPIGPFGFLKYVAALGDNLFFGILFYSLVKACFVFFLLKLGKKVTGRITILSFLVALMAAAFTGIDYAIVGSTIILLLLQHIDNKGKTYFFIANLFALSGLFIKSSIGISSFAAIFTFFLVGFSSSRFSLRRLSMLLAYAVILFIATGILVLGSVNSLYRYIIGFMHLAEGYSDGLALFPSNNWWLLTGFLITLPLALVLKKRNVTVALLFMLLPLFAMWKHAMGREDISHAGMLYGFLYIYWAILFHSASNRRFILIVFATLSIILYHANLRHIPGYTPYLPQLNGLANFNESVIHYGSFNEEYSRLSRENILPNAMEESVRSQIGKARVDVYPWDLSYIPANGFMWAPRPTLELGASTSAWLSQLAATNYRGPQAPGYVILHLQNDRWGGKLGSLDGRYLLNDEPTVVELFVGNYSIRLKTGKFLLLQKQEGKILRKSQGKQIKEKWNRWIDVPPAGERVIRLSFSYQKTLPGHIKSFFYKGEALYIDYRFSDGKIRTYRFLGSNAVDGLWINPFILRPEKSYGAEPVEAVRFRCGNDKMVRPEFEISWQYLSSGDGLAVMSWFGFHGNRNDQIIFEQCLEYGLYRDSSAVTSTVAEKPGAGTVNPGDYSGSLEVGLDTIWKEGDTGLEVEAEVFFSLPPQYQGGAMLVLALEGSPADDWLAFPLSREGREDRWHYACLGKELHMKTHDRGRVKAYVWNNGETPVTIDALTIRLIK